MAYLHVTRFCLIMKALGEEKHSLLESNNCTKQDQVRFAKKLLIGNLNAKRDWGHAMDYVDSMVNSTTKKPDDFVISTGKNYSKKQFINMCAKILDIKLNWEGKEFIQKAYDDKGKCIIECSKKYYRPTRGRHFIR